MSGYTILRAATLAVILVGVLFAVTLAQQGPRSASAPTDLYGVPFPIVNEATEIQSAIAHFDVNLTEPVLQKELVLSAAFSPGATKFIGVGVRSNSFWLSYDPLPLYDHRTSDGATLQTKEVHIPLTNKLQDTDRSIDVMLFTSESWPFDPATLIDQPASWQLHSLDVAIANTQASPLQMADYLLGLVTRERPL